MLSSDSFRARQLGDARGALAKGLILLVLAGCAGSRVASDDESAVPPTPREFRAAWVASVANIDWPSQPALSSTEQQSELLAILDRAVALNLNAIILQIRPAGDALYVSAYEPWSEYLTGHQGAPPFPFYDPLEFAVEEAHRRGLELHAWFNPFRARHATAESPAHPKHVSRTNAEIVLDYGDQQWIDPGVPRAREYVLEVMLDVVRRYDLDGIHIDDYFYPYEITDSLGAPVPFPDTLSFAAVLDDSTFTMPTDSTERALADWRRSNVDAFVEQLYARVKQAKPHIKVGISPFGIWRPGHPPQIEGFDAYDRIYADARKWLREGWVDYFTPQLYWSIDGPAQSYPVLLEWWSNENVLGRHIWPGNFTSRVIAENQTVWEPAEILRQIDVTRGTAAGSGNVHFSMKAIMPHATGMGRALAAGPYDGPAIVPDTPWLNGAAPSRPQLAWDDLADRNRLLIRPGGLGSPRLWVVKVLGQDGWEVRVVPAWHRAVDVGDGGQTPRKVVVTAVDRLGAESESAELGPRVGYATSR